MKYIIQICNSTRIPALRTVWAAFALVVGLCCYSSPASAQAAGACDLNNDGTVNTADVDLAVSMSLGAATCTANIQAPGVCNAVTVQRVVNKAIGGTAAPCVTGYPHSVTLTWAASTYPNVTYKVLRATSAGGPYTTVGTGLSGVTLTDSQVQAGLTYYYVVRVVDSSGAESPNSNEASTTIPTP